MTARHRCRAASIKVAVGVFALAVALTASGCESRASADNAKDATASPTSQPAPKATVTFATSSTKPLRPDAKITLKASDGLLTKVTATANDGTALQGAVAKDNLTWTSRGPLPVNSTIAVKATARNPEGVITSRTASFTTLKPKDTERASISPLTGQIVGIAMPITVDFDYKVTNKAAVEKRLVTQSAPAAVGSWHWVNSRQVQYRPAEYWRAGTDVTVTADLRGVEIADGIWGATRKPVNFTIGKANVSVVDIGRHTLTAKTDDQVVRTIPVTTGKPGLATREGVKVIMSQEQTHRMDAATTGVEKDDPEYYNLVVSYAQRLTYSGEFFHAAPWSEWAQGRQNVSHGCTGMSMANARWFMNRSRVGDPVEFVNGSRPLEPGNGWTMWNTSYPDWKLGSALY